MKTYLTYGFGIALTTAIWLLLQNLFGLHSDPAKLVWAERAQHISNLIALVGIWLGLRRVRALRADHRLSYGRCVGAGVMIALVWGVLSTPVVYTYYGKINPEYVELMKQRQIDVLRNSGARDAVVEQQQRQMDTFLSAGFMTAITPVVTVLTGLVMSLLLGLTMIHRLSATALTVCYGAIFGFFGLLQGFGAGILKHAVLATAGTYLLIGAVVGALVPFVLLKVTKYQPESVVVERETAEPPVI